MVKCVDIGCKVEAAVMVRTVVTDTITLQRPAVDAVAIMEITIIFNNKF